MSKPIQLRFEGEGPALQFVEVENENGESIDVGEWIDDGEYQLLRLEVEE